MNELMRQTDRQKQTNNQANKQRQLEREVREALMWNLALTITLSTSGLKNALAAFDLTGTL